MSGLCPILSIGHKASAARGVGRTGCVALYAIISGVHGQVYQGRLWNVMMAVMIWQHA